MLIMKNQINHLSLRGAQILLFGAQSNLMRDCFAVLALASLVLVLSSCEQSIVDSDVQGTPRTFLSIVNTIASGGAVVYNVYPADSITNNNSRRYVFDATVSGNNRIQVYAKNNQSMVYCDTVVAMENGNIYSLFLGGTVTAVAKVFIREEQPLYATDSTFRVRFINLASNGPAAVNVTLSTSATTNEFASIPFMGVSGFRTYGAKSTASGDPASRTFQIRNSATNALITSGSLPTSFSTRFGMTTIVFRGIVGGSPAPGVTNIIY